jgi:hypothetical protein
MPDQLCLLVNTFPILYGWRLERSDLFLHAEEVSARLIRKMRPSRVSKSAFLKCQVSELSTKRQSSAEWLSKSRASEARPYCTPCKIPVGIETAAFNNIVISFPLRIAEAEKP